MLVYVAAAHHAALESRMPGRELCVLYHTRHAPGRASLLYHTRVQAALSRCQAARLHTWPASPLTPRARHRWQQRIQQGQFLLQRAHEKIVESLLLQILVKLQTTATALLVAQGEGARAEQLLTSDKQKWASDRSLMEERDTLQAELDQLLQTK